MSIKVAQPTEVDDRLYSAATRKELKEQLVDPIYGANVFCENMWQAATHHWLHQAGMAVVDNWPTNPEQDDAMRDELREKYGCVGDLDEEIGLLPTTPNYALFWPGREILAGKAGHNDWSIAVRCSIEAIDVSAPPLTKFEGFQEGIYTPKTLEHVRALRDIPKQRSAFQACMDAIQHAQGFTRTHAVVTDKPCGLFYAREVSCLTEGSLEPNRTVPTFKNLKGPNALVRGERNFRFIQPSTGFSGEIRDDTFSEMYVRFARPAHPLDSPDSE
ncbi:MAG: hypothetical protein QF486_02795 [Candidatus Woesearchaeota archaeon]|nr:hypothetical protein [Candidatus Woesearchaeota archaeon]MDP7198524.1 hypothetical protein [Candidatus Woesearchaeota archaeon]MDP7466734.1 hypothetical protein [Candidatus Woesearchaeota archaeon]MDP7647959.1 hypothetical protein [Candidatus Woesearchaeota archaeon]|tara:strand:- start:389 stop:1207 length:819 start_codon:yes stop_codon:yes gene_type:complete